MIDKISVKKKQLCTMYLMEHSSTITCRETSIWYLWISTTPKKYVPYQISKPE